MAIHLRNVHLRRDQALRKISRLALLNVICLSALVFQRG